MTDTWPDEQWMREAAALAEAAEGLASPNPTVGCVLLREGEIVGRGAHLYDERDHAEIVALKQAGHRARGATAYVTLEPCSHSGRTGPCADALVVAGVSRVVVATQDPNPQVAGRGMARLRAAGIKVTLGPCEERARSLNRPFARHIRTGLPFVTLKAGLSLDGRIAPSVQHGTHYLTSQASLEAVHRMRHRSDALVTGAGTVLADDPLLTDRSALPRRRPLLRVILDPQLRTPPTARLFSQAPETVLVLTANGSTAAAEALRSRGAEVQATPLTPEGRIDLQAAFGELGGRGILSVLAEAGPALTRSLLEGGHVDQLTLFYAPLLLGGDAVPLLGPGKGLPLHPARTSCLPSGPDLRADLLLRDPWPEATEAPAASTF